MHADDAHRLPPSQTLSMLALHWAAALNELALPACKCSPPRPPSSPTALNEFNHSVQRFPSVAQYEGTLIACG